MGGDGNRVRPDLYLCDHFGPFAQNDEDKVFSVLAIDDLLPETLSNVDITEIKKTAEITFDSASAEFDIKNRCRPLLPQRRVFSGDLSTNADRDQKLEVWSVRFVDTGSIRWGLGSGLVFGFRARIVQFVFVTK